MSSIRRVLLLSGRVGAGHVRAADALAEACGAWPGVEVRHLECLGYMNPALRYLLLNSYTAVYRHAPALWRLLYERTEKRPVDTWSKRRAGALQALALRALLRELRLFDPDVVVCTHYIPGAVVARERRRGRLRARVAMVLTDMAAHPIWLHPGVDQYFVANVDMERALQTGGVKTKEVWPEGIPIRACFRPNADSKDVTRTRLRLAPHSTTALVMAGGAGTGRMDRVVRRLAEACPQLQIVAVAGAHKAVYTRLQALAAVRHGQVVACGFVSNLHELMAASDFTVCKPGGLSSSECLAMGLPMIIVDPIPGQEERNAAVLLSTGAAWQAGSLDDLVTKAGALASDPQKRTQMCLAAQAAARPEAAPAIVSRIIDR